MSKYLDDSGLGHLWSILKGKIETKQDALLPDATLEVNGAHIGVSVPTEGMTQAEYDALPAAGKARGLKIITDSTPLPANYVEDYTTEDGWHVRKYSDGYVELHRAFSNSLAVSDWADSANGWNALLFKFCPLPLSLTERYSEYLSLNGTSSGATAMFYQDNSYYSGSTTGWWQAFRPWSKPTSTVNLEMNLVITGRWK